MPCRCPWNLRRSCCLLLLLVAGLSCTGSAQDSTQTYPVHGVVLDSITHQPIARALVEEQSDAALTDSNGRFELQLPSQIVTITARRPGYDAQSDATRTLQVSASTPEVTFQLTPHAFITGHLELPDEADAAGMQVAAYRARMRHGVRTWEFAGAAIARSDGSFRLVPPQSGIFILRTYPVAENSGQSWRDCGRRGEGLRISIRLVSRGGAAVERRRTQAWPRSTAERQHGPHAPGVSPGGGVGAWRARWNAANAAASR